MARLSSTIPPGHWKEWGDGVELTCSCKNFNEHMDKEDESLRVLQEESELVDTDGDITGALVYFPVADGKAIYRVQSFSLLVLQHVPFGDAYMIPMAHIRGLVLSDIRRMLSFDAFFRSLPAGA